MSNHLPVTSLNVFYRAKKKLADIAKYSAFRKLSSWIRSITNHLYFVVRKSDANTQLREDMWKSVHNHLQNIHVHPKLKAYPRCSHEEMPARWVDDITGKTMVRNYLVEGNNRNVSYIMFILLHHICLYIAKGVYGSWLHS